MRNYLFDRNPSLTALACVSEAEGAAAQAAKRRSRRRGIWAGVLFFVLICALTVTAVLLRRLEGSLEENLEEAGDGYSSWDPYFGVGPGGYASWGGQTSIARAPVGVKPLLSLSEPQGEALTAEDIYQKVLPSVVSVTAYSDQSAQRRRLYHHQLPRDRGHGPGGGHPPELRADQSRQAGGL